MLGIIKASGSWNFGINFGHGNKSQKAKNAAGHRNVPTTGHVCQCFGWNWPLWSVIVRYSDYLGVKWKQRWEHGSKLKVVLTDSLKQKKKKKEKKNIWNCFLNDECQLLQIVSVYNIKLSWTMTHVFWILLEKQHWSKLL